MSLQLQPSYDRERWQVQGRPYASTREVVASRAAPLDRVTAVYAYDEVGAPRRTMGATIGATAGAAAGLLLSGMNVGLAAAGAAVGGSLGAWLAPRRRHEHTVAGALVGTTFHPQGDAARAVDLAACLRKSEAVASHLEEAKAAPASIAEIRSLPEFAWNVPTRDQQIARLKDATQTWDVIVLGGGATGTGTALEAARRGCKVALVEAFDFASGTSSRSTKLIHGGVRYLENAMKNLDREQYELVKEGLHERQSFLRMAPHLTNELRLVTPCYHWWQVPYYFMGLSIYDRIAGHENLQATRMLTRSATETQLPDLKRDGLVGGVEFSDGEFNDSRMAVGLALTAAAHGAAVANYVRVDGLVQDNGKTVGVQLRDSRSGDVWTVRAKVVINATGPFIDAVRKMDDPAAAALVVPSAGTHITVQNLNMPQGVLVPKAPNGSVAFFKPFEGGTLIGTTEEKTAITFEPTTTADQVAYLRDLANEYLDPAHHIQDKDITSVWTGIRPLVRDPKEPLASGGSVRLSRKHVVEVSDAGLVTIGGGKWTSFGRMAQDAVDAALPVGGLPMLPTQRDSARVIGAHGYSEALPSMLAADFGLDAEVANHLARNYGDRAVAVADLARHHGLDKRLSAHHPYLEAEVVYAARHEYAVDPVDVLSRRTRLAFVDEAAALQALPRVTELMAAELGWTPQAAARHLTEAQAWAARNGKTELGAGTPLAVPSPLKTV